MFQECFHIFQNDLEVRLLLSVLDRDSGNAPEKENLFKSVLSVLRQFVATESPLKMMKNVFYSTLKALFVLKILNFCHVEKPLD